MRERKLISGVNWQEALKNKKKRKKRKTNGHKTTSWV
jgi:hypothetical protein